MIDVSKIDKGNTNGTNRGETNNKNLRIYVISKSLPANSDINNQMDCSKKINISIRNTEKNVFKKLNNIYRSSTFTPMINRCD